MKKDVPEKIYKYQPPSINAITNLSAAQIWFADPLSFNDPFDCAGDLILEQVASGLQSLDAPTALEIAISLKLTVDSMTAIANCSEERIISIVQSTLTKAFDEQMKRRMGVSCFCERYDDLLMWSHYADCHKGVCLEFTTTKMPFANREKLHPVIYTDCFPKCEVCRFSSNDGGLFLEYLLTKATKWEYEEEWRLFHKERNTQYGYERECLTGVYCGARMSDAQKMMIAAIVDYTDTQLYSMTLDKERFQLNRTPFSFERIDYRQSSS